MEVDSYEAKMNRTFSYCSHIIRRCEELPRQFWSLDNLYKRNEKTFGGRLVVRRKTKNAEEVFLPKIMLNPSIECETRRCRVTMINRCISLGTSAVNSKIMQ